MLRRRLIERCNGEGFEAIVLYSDKPASARSLDPWEPVDLAFLQGTLKSRMPVSDG
jgi:hypothetical protein